MPTSQRVVNGGVKVALARVEEKQVALGERFDEFRGEWRENATTLRADLKEIKKVAECHEHKDLSEAVAGLKAIASNGDKLARVVAVLGGLIALASMVLGFLGK